MTGTTGKLVERITYDAYGNGTGSTRTRYGYTGRERDPLNGLLYYRARFYDPQLGRFISEDPIGLRGGINSFSYVNNEPTNFTDPEGLWEPKAHREIIRLAFKDCLSQAQMDQLVDASDYMDGLLNGGAWMEAYAYQHGMRAPNESIAHARNAANAFMAEEMRMAAQSRQAFDSRFPLLTGGISAGLSHFGNALHTITDMFSPAHQGFQIWHGPPTPTGITALHAYRAAEYAQYVRRHSAQETLEVLLSDQGRLDRIIKAARDAYFDTFGKSACECAN